MITLIHTHGIGDIDYSSMHPSDLVHINEQAKTANLNVIPSVFLARDYMDTFEDVLKEYKRLESQLTHIKGFSVEGPLLGSSGGVPPRGIWRPNASEWKRISSFGPLGLKYIVFGPDGADLHEEIEDVSLSIVLSHLYTNGVKVALGHFQHGNPELSAKRTMDVISFIRENFGTTQDLILTDHLYNDMPSNFRHAWRTRELRMQRVDEILPVLNANWDTCDLEKLLGPVPAVLLKEAKKGHILPFLNFDGDHVDLDICMKTLSFLGPENLVAMTDDTPIPVLAGELLTQNLENGLWYRSDGIVAAGTGNWKRQLDNLDGLGVSDDDKERLFSKNPQRVILPLL